MNFEIEKIIKKRPITQEDLEGAKGYLYKSKDNCLFEQIKCTDQDIIGHDSTINICTKTEKSVEVIPYIHCAKCNTCISVEEYTLENNI